MKTTLLEGGAMATPLPLKMGLGVPVVLPNPTQKAQLTIGGHRYDCSIIKYTKHQRCPHLCYLESFFLGKFLYLRTQLGSQIFVCGNKEVLVFCWDTSLKHEELWILGSGCGRGRVGNSVLANNLCHYL